MKILHVIPTMNPKSGGPCQGIRNYEYGLNVNEIHRDVVCFDEEKDVSQWNNTSLNIHPLGYSHTPWQYNNVFHNWLSNHVHEYDVVIINGIWLYHSYATIKVLFKLKHRPKVFIMPHGMLDPWFQRATNRKLKSIRNYIYWNLIEKNVINKADGILFTCQTELELARKTFAGYRPKREINVGYGIQSPPLCTRDMEAAFNLKYDVSKNGKYLLFLSRINEKKGLDLLIEAYNLLMSEGLDSKLPKLVIAGPGIESIYGKKILKLVSKYKNLADKIYFVGMLQGDEKWGAIYGCETFVLPSHQENFGIAVVEALACGKSVLISNQVNIWKEIEQEQAGLIYEDTIESLTSTLRNFIELNSEEKKIIEQKALATFDKFFDIKKVALNFIKALK